MRNRLLSAKVVLPALLFFAPYASTTAIAAPKAVEFIDAIPLTPVGKADKKALRARFWGDAQRSVN